MQANTIMYCLHNHNVVMTLCHVQVPGAAAVVNKGVLLPACDSSWLQKFSIPENFSRYTEHALKTGQITKAEIVTAIAFRIFAFTEYPTSDEYKAVCSMLIGKYSVLKDTIGNGIVSLSQLRYLLNMHSLSPLQKTQFIYFIYIYIYIGIMETTTKTENEEHEATTREGTETQSRR